jgi:hypothetical protein
VFHEENGLKTPSCGPFGRIFSLEKPLASPKWLAIDLFSGITPVL